LCNHSTKAKNHSSASFFLSLVRLAEFRGMLSVDFNSGRASKRSRLKKISDNLRYLREINTQHGNCTTLLPASKIIVPLHFSAPCKAGGRWYKVRNPLTGCIRHPEPNDVTFQGLYWQDARLQGFHTALDSHAGQGM
jgi:hypothetical protein